MLGVLVGVATGVDVAPGVGVGVAVLLGVFVGSPEAVGVLVGKPALVGPGEGVIDGVGVRVASGVGEGKTV